MVTGFFATLFSSAQQMKLPTHLASDQEQNCKRRIAFPRPLSLAIAEVWRLINFA